MRIMESVQEILEDREHGSVDLLVCLIRRLQEGIRSEGLSVHELDEIVQGVADGRPGMAVFAAFREIVRKWVYAQVGKTELDEKLEQIAEDVLGTNRILADYGADRVPAGLRPIAFYSRSSVLLELGRRIHDRQPERMFWVAQARQHDEGYAMAEDLEGIGAPVRLWTDTAFFSMVSHVSVLFCSADFCTAEGIGNKIGTRPLVQLAQIHGIPRYGLVMEMKILPERQWPRFHKRASDRKVVEQTGCSALWGGDLDRTPLDCWSGLVTSEGVFRPKAFSRRYFHRSP